MQFCIKLCCLIIVFTRGWSRGHMARGQGQGQPFQGQTLSRPRTGMLEAKAKVQGNKRKCVPKKKGLKKIFLGDLKKKVFKKMLHAISSKNGLEKIFSADLQIFNHSKK